MRVAAVAVTVLCLCSVASADIIEWQDAQGVRHYTNLQAAIPKEQQQSARIVVDEAARRSALSAGDAGAAHAAPAPTVTEAPRQAEVVYDWSEVSNAYRRGLEQGLAVARPGARAEGGHVQITGPLAVATATNPAPYYGYPFGNYYPFVTTSFDRGRSRHLTLRMLLQDQFAIDRAAPFVFAERLEPPFGYPVLGVALNPFLPRGLPHGFPRRTRVVTR